MGLSEAMLFAFAATIICAFAIAEKIIDIDFEQFMPKNLKKAKMKRILAKRETPLQGARLQKDIKDSFENVLLPLGKADKGYLAGYLADKYDVTAEESIDRANERVKKSTEQAFAETVIGYDTVVAENTSVQFHGGKAKYALYPVWLLNTTWNGNKYTFAMNGQTGKFVGDLPVDKAAATRWTLMLATTFTAVTYGAATLLHFLGLF